MMSDVKVTRVAQFRSLNGIWQNFVVFTSEKLIAVNISIYILSPFNFNFKTELQFPTELIFLCMIIAINFPRLSFFRFCFFKIQL